MTLVPLTILVPLVAAGLLAASRPLASRLLADVTALGAAVAVLVMCAILTHRASHGEIVYWWGAWRPHGGVSLGISFAFDSLGAGFATFAAALMVAALVFSWRFFETVDHLYHTVLLVFLAAMVGFCLSGDLFNMFVFFELMGVSAYVLAGFLIEHRSPLEGSLNFAITNSAGGVLVLFGIGLIYGRTGALNLAQIGQTLGHVHPDGLVVAGFALVVCGFLVKAAAVPFHFWLADAYAVAPTPVCILFAGAMSELGLLGVARVYWTSFAGVFGAHEGELRAVLVTVGIVTALAGALMTLGQHHLKRMLAFATVSYIGLFLVGVGLLSRDGLGGAAAYVVGDGLVKASLFVCVGILQHRCASVDEVDLHGRGRVLPIAGVLFGVGALAVAGLPPFGPFLGKALVEDAALGQPGYGWVPALMLIAAALSGGAILRAGARVFLGLGPRGEPDESSDEAREEAEPESEEPHDSTPWLMWVPALALMAAGLAWGLIPDLSHSIGAAAARFVDHAGYARAVLDGVLTTPGHVLAPHGASPGSYLYGVGAALGAVAVAALALIRDGERRLGPLMALRAPLQGLRRLHSGHVGDYVAWLTAGVTVIGGVFMIALI
ncbi:MAG: NADH-quinone oxidoreductase subunit D [Actinobacteria bacterium]|nr:MAG: NADH-quinone oxidoreductase subunit D [Actinomycetota bacterium]